MKIEIHLTENEGKYAATFGKPYRTKIEGKSKDGVLKRAAAACEKMGLEWVVVEG